MHTDFNMEKPSWTFQEWTVFLEYVKNNSVSEELLRKTSKINLDFRDNLGDKLEDALYDAVNHMVARIMKSFEKEMMDLVEFNETEFFDLILFRLKKNLRACLFFEQLDFISSDIRQTLADDIREELQEHWLPALKKWLYENTLESRSDSLEDMLYLLNKTRLFSNE